MTLVPAYGRDYKSAKEVLADWAANKDFIIADFHSPDNGRYCNKADFDASKNPSHLQIRYAKQTKVVVVK